MAETLDFTRVEVIVCEANEPLRRNIQQLLRQLGFGEIVVKEHPEECVPILEKGPVDLLICDDQESRAACFGMVHGLRHQAIDNNPFVVSVGMVDKHAGETGVVTKAVNAGSDALIVKPFTTAVFIERIFAIAERRRPFVATADYIGPTRRRTPRNKREAMMEFTVPNPVKEIATGKTRDATADLIHRGAFLLNKRKLSVDLDEIELRAHDVRDAIDRVVDGEIIARALDKLRAATSDVKRRMQKDEVEHAPQLCRWMFDVADRIEDETTRDDPRNTAVIPEILKGFRVAVANMTNRPRPETGPDTKPRPKS